MMPALTTGDRSCHAFTTASSSESCWDSFLLELSPTVPDSVPRWSERPCFLAVFEECSTPLGGTEKARFSGLFLLVEIVLYSVLYRNVSLQDVVGLREQCERLLPFPGADAWGDAIRAGREASPKGRARGMDAPERTRKAATAAGRQGGPGQGCSAGPTVRHGCRSRGTPR